MKLSKLYNELIRGDWADQKDTKGSQRNADAVLNYFGDDHDIRSITYQDVQAFTESLKKKGMSGSTINRKLAALSKMYTVAQRHDRRIARVEITRQKESKPRQRVLTDAEALALTSYPWANPTFRDFTVLLMDTGIRPSEITRGEWRVQGDELTLVDTKNGDDRTVLLTPEAQEAAQRLRKSNGRIHYSTYSLAFRTALKELGIKGDVVPYTMRHTALTRLGNATENVILIQKWAGHKNLQTTQRYIKVSRKGLEGLANVLRRS